MTVMAQALAADVFAADLFAADVLSADIGDPDSTRTILAIIALLIVMGLALIMLAFWLRRATRPDPELLAPLELMGERSWRRGDPVWQRRRLDEVRPDGATPLTKPAAPPRFDETFDAGPPGTGFDDLRQTEPEPETDDAAEPPEPTDEPERADAADATAPHEQPTRTTDDTAEPSEPASLDSADEAGDQETGGDPDDEGARTPISSRRPLIDDLPDGEIDPEALQRAMDELDAELHHDADDR